MTRTTDARTLALRTLDTLERRRGFADATLDAQFSRHPDLGPADRALASHLVYGVLRWRNVLDAHVARASTRPLDRIHPRLLQVLRIGTYQLRFLDRVPDRAAVNESVELARRAGLDHAAGFVNAVLRRIAAAGDLPEPEGEVARLALRFGCPAWLVERWRADHGPETAAALCASASRIPDLWLRIGPGTVPRAEALDRLAAAGVTAEAGAYGPEAVRVEHAGDPRRLPLVAEGLALVQDQGSQLVPHLVAPEPGWRVLDVCAGPGLKATHLARLGARVTAVDVHSHRARMVEELARRVGAAVEVAVADGREFAPPEPFDAALVDAPCSGLGVLHRNPEAKWRLTPADLEGFPPLQLALLSRTARSVRPGGILVYSTCTNLPAENEGVVTAFLAGHPGFEPEAPPVGAAAWEGLLDPRGLLRTFPPRGEGARALDGFFGVRLRRTA